MEPSDICTLKDYFTLAIAIVGFASLLWTIVWSALRVRKDQERLAIIANLNKRIDIELKIAENPGYLKFHGIKEKDIVDAGFTLKEFAYLVASFTAGELWYRVYEKDRKTAPKNSLRDRMLENEETRRAWEFVKVMINDSKYVDMIDNSIKEKNKYRPVNDE